MGGFLSLLMLLITCILGPLASAILYFNFSNLLGRRTHILMLLTYALSVFCSLYLLYIMSSNAVSSGGASDIVIILPLLKLSNFLSLNIELAATLLSSLVLSVILLISFAVNTYALYYMAYDAMVYRFMGLLCAFTTCMALLAISSNVITLFIYWELIGLFSYLLIGYWSDRILATISSLKALFMNKVGDVTLTIGIVILISQLSTTELSLVNTVIPHYFDQTLVSSNLNISTLFIVLILIAAAAKSAQILLHTWLSDAMQGPTPVSALLHAATLVVAGVILLVKLSSMLALSNLSLLPIIGIISAILGGVLALGQSDSKGIIAYSTLSQFGYIVSISSLASISISYLHISTHACFKAALFMCAGIIIHSNYDMQDIRSYGSLVKLLPITYACILSSIASLIAVPYMSGNISKDLIIEAHSAQYTNYNSFSFTLGLIAALITTVYSVKLLLYIFYSSNNSNRSSFESVHEANLYALIPITVLALLATCLGFLLMGFTIDYTELVVNTELWSQSIKPIPVLVVSIGILMCVVLYNYNPIKLAKQSVNNTGTNLSWVIPNNSSYGAGSIVSTNLVSHILFNRLYFDTITSMLHYNYLRLAYFLSVTIDLGVLELFGLNGLSRLYQSHLGSPTLANTNIYPSNSTYSSKGQSSTIAHIQS